MARDDRLNETATGRSTPFHQVLIILFATLFLGGGADTLEERVEDVLPEGDRRQRAIEVTNQLDRLTNEEVNSFIDFHEAFYRTIDENPGSRTELRSVLDAQLESAREFDRDLADRFTELREILTPEEWGEVFDD